MGKEIFIGWWNVEKLFDIDGHQNRSDWLAKRIKNELEGWTADKLALKLNRLSAVIAEMNNGFGPDILGLCEVESQSVLDKLLEYLSPLGRSYKIAISSGADKRGIDVALLYDQEVVDIEKDSSGKDLIFSHRIQKRSPTRDLLQINFVSKAGNPLIVIGNHWPSRRPSELETEPYRYIAGETLSYFIDRITEIRGDIAIVVLGDFNDEPFSRSITKHALSTNDKDKVASDRVRLNYLYNLMWGLKGKNMGTYVYHNNWYMLDQVMVNKALLGGTEYSCDASDVSIVGFDEEKPLMRPVSHGLPSSEASYNPLGASDHHPVSVIIHEKT